MKRLIRQLFCWLLSFWCKKNGFALEIESKTTTLKIKYRKD